MLGPRTDMELVGDNDSISETGLPPACGKLGGAVDGPGFSVTDNTKTPQRLRKILKYQNQQEHSPRKGNTGCLGLHALSLPNLPTDNTLCLTLRFSKRGVIPRVNAASFKTNF